MNNIQFDNDNFIMYSPDSLKYLTDGMEKILNDSLEDYKYLFDIDNFRKIQINYFDDLDEFRNYIYNLRGEKESLPEYAKGTFDKGMINAYIESNIIKDTALYNKKRYNASHELFHIMYQELVWEKNNLPRVIWFDEGMAQLFSGEYENELEDYETFIKNVISNTKTIPNLNELSHGFEFETDDYSGYKLSLLAVKYIYDKIGIEDFKKILYDIDKIHEYGKNILFEIFKMYK